MPIVSKNPIIGEFFSCSIIVHSHSNHEYKKALNAVHSTTNNFIYRKNQCMLFNKILNAFADVDLTTELGELAVILTRDPTTYTDKISQIIQYSNISQQNSIYFQPHCIVTPKFLIL